MGKKGILPICIVMLLFVVSSDIFPKAEKRSVKKSSFQSISEFWHNKPVPLSILGGYITAEPSILNYFQEKISRLVSNMNGLDISNVNKEYSPQESGGLFTELGQNLKNKILAVWNDEAYIPLSAFDGDITAQPSIFQHFKLPSFYNDGTVSNIIQHEGEEALKNEYLVYNEYPSLSNMQGFITAQPSMFQGFATPQFNDQGTMLHILHEVGEEALKNELLEQESFFVKAKQYIAQIFENLNEPDSIALYVAREREKFEKEMEKYLQYDDLEGKLDAFENHLKDFNQNIEQDKQELLVRAKHIKKLKHNDTLKKGLATKIDKMASKMIFVDKDLQDRYEKLYSEFNNTVDKKLSSTQELIKNEMDNKFKQLEQKLTKKEKSADYNLSKKEISYLIRESVKRHMYLSKETVGKQRKYEANEVVEIIQKMLSNK